MPRRTTSFEQYRERFWSKVDKTETCWLWTAGTLPFGYGCFNAKSLDASMGYREIHAHRWAWIFEYGPIPAGMFVLHGCDVPACVRPDNQSDDHLHLGTQLDNMRERRARRADWGNAGERNRHVLTDAAVASIRERSKTTSQRALAREFGVNPSTISRIVGGLRWRHL